jgi:hypothetical protein
MNAGYIGGSRDGSDYRRSERSQCLFVSRYVGPCLRPLSLGLSLACESSDFLRREVEPGERNRIDDRIPGAGLDGQVVHRGRK